MVVEKCQRLKVEAEMAALRALAASWADLRVAERVPRAEGGQEWWPGLKGAARGREE